MKKHFVCIVVILAVMVLPAISAFSQGPEVPVKDNTSPTPAAQAAPAQAPQAAPAEAAAKTSEPSIYGEVQAVNAPAALISVQY